MVSNVSFCQISSILYPQQIDSLHLRLKVAAGTEKVDVLNNLSLYLAPRHFDSSLNYAGQALQLAEKLNYKKGIGIATFNIGNSYYFRMDVKNALTNYLAALRILEPYEPSKEIGNLLIQLGALNQYVRNTEKSTTYYTRAAFNFASVGDSASRAWAFYKISDSHFHELQTLSSIDTIPKGTKKILVDSSLHYLNICLAYNLTHNAQPYFIVNLYNLFGILYLYKDNSKTLVWYQKALETARTISETDAHNKAEGLVLMNIGNFYLYNLNDRDTSYIYATMAANLLKNSDRYDLYAAALKDLGEIELYNGHYNSSKQYLDRSFKYYDLFLSDIDEISHQDPTFRIWSVTQARATRIGLLKDFIQLFESISDYRNAHLYSKKLLDEKRIQAQDELTRQVIGMQANYDDELKRKEIAELEMDNKLQHLKLNRSRIIFIGFGAFLLISLLLVLLWIQRKRFRSERKILVMEQKLLRAQMNPHFIYNSLYSIQNFIVTEKPDKASIYLSKFSRLVRNILDSSTQEFIPLEKEISTIENYLELQKVRYAGKFEYTINIADKIDPEITMIPPTLAQPFIENAIEHGIKHRETPGHIDIRFSIKDHTLIFEVEDDGVGRQKAFELETAQDPDHHSMSTSLTQKRLKNLNRKHSKKIFLDILDLKNELGEAAGTKVTFVIPV
jgi:signal transduction histidine kinase